MSKQKKKVVVKAEDVTAEVLAPAQADAVVEAVIINPKDVSNLKPTEVLIIAKEKLESCEIGHREINLAIQDAVTHINRAHALATFIEVTQADLNKKKR